MKRTTVVIIGAGQAGLAVSHLLTSASVDHVLLERGTTAESWRSRRWDSLHLLTPNWMTRLPGWSYRGLNPEGFMSAAAVATYLRLYARSFAAPVVPDAQVRSVTWRDGEYRVVSTAGTWISRSVVVATGYCDRPAVPQLAEALHPSIHTFTPDSYRNPREIPDGGVFVVGSSSTGVQLADELAGAGREVVLAVGRHTRMLRTYRGMDIMWWLDSMGLQDKQAVPGTAPRRHERSLQLVGSAEGRDVDIPSLAGRGVNFTGRLTGVRDGVVHVAGDLSEVCQAADAKLRQLLERIDKFAEGAGLDREIEAPSRPIPAAFSGASDPFGTELDLRAAGIRSVIWATGYRRRYPWLRLPVFDSNGEIRHTSGLTDFPGLMVIGMQWQTRRNSSFLDGVRHDAAIVVDHVVNEVLAGSSAYRRAS